MKAMKRRILERMFVVLVYPVANPRILRPRCKLRPMIRVIANSVTIDASPSEVWRAQTDPELRKQWMAEPVMRVEIAADWTMELSTGWAP